MRLKAESRHKLHSAQNSQRVFCEFIRNMAQYSVGKIFLPSPRILIFSGERIEIDCVHSEIPSRSSIPYGHHRIRIYEKPLVACTSLRLSSRERNIDVMPVNLENAKGNPNQVETEALFKGFAQSIWRKTKNLNVEILDIRLRQKPIANAPANQKCAAARIANDPRYL